jgi:DNA-binding transcriptional LysR family regulator
VLTKLEALQAVGREAGDSLAGHVVIGAPASTGNIVAVPLLQAARERYPDVGLGLQESPSVYLGELLLRGRLDIAVLFEESLAPGMNSVPVIEEDLFVLGLKTRSREVDLARLQGVPLVMPARPNSVRALLDRACTERGVTLEVVAEVSSPYTMVQLARAGIGATVLPWSMLGASSASAAPGLPVARIVNPVLSRTIAVATAMDLTQSPSLIAIRSLLVEIMKGLVASSQWQGARLKGSQA